MYNSLITSCAFEKKTRKKPTKFSILLNTQHTLFPPCVSIPDLTLFAVGKAEKNRENKTQDTTDSGIDFTSKC